MSLSRPCVTICTKIADYSDDPRVKDVCGLYRLDTAGLCCKSRKECKSCNPYEVMSELLSYAFNLKRIDDASQGMFLKKVTRPLSNKKRLPVNLVDRENKQFKTLKFNNIGLK